MLFNPTQAYHNELVKIFIDALIADKDSKYNKSTHLEVLEAILNNKLVFSIDKNNTIYEKSGDNLETKIFSNSKKNEEAIYCIKILLSEYGINTGINEND